MSKKIYVSTNGKEVIDADVINFYKQNSIKQTAEHFGLKNNEICAIAQRNKFFKIGTIKDPEPVKLKPMPPVGARVKIGNMIKQVIESHKHFFVVLVNYGAEVRPNTVHRSDCWELVG